MATQALQMLDMAANHTARMFGQVDEMMTKSLALRQQNSDNLVNLTYKGLQFAEQQRMNDANIQQMNNANELSARKFQMDAEMQPLRMESMRLQMENQRVTFERNKEQQDREAFNAITKVYDDMTGLFLLETRNPEHAKAVTDYKGRWMSKVMQGEQFSGESYAKGLRKINETFQDQKVDAKNYNPVLSHMLGTVSPVAQNRYEMENPAFAKNKNALSSSLISSTDAGFTDMMTKYGNFWTPDQLGYLSVTRDIYKNNQALIDSSLNQLQRVRSQLALSETEEDRNNIISIAQELQASINEARAQNSAIINNAARGIYSFDQDPVAQQVTEELPGPNLSESQPKPKVLGFSANTERDQPMLQRLQGIKSFLTDTENEPTEIDDINLSWWEGRIRDKAPDITTLSNVRNKIEERIEALGNLGSRFNSDRVDKLFSSLNRETEVPISGFLFETLNKHVSQSILDKIIENPISARFSNATPIIRFNSKSQSALDNEFTMEPGRLLERLGGADTGINNYSNLLKLLNHIPNKTEREEAKKELYASLLTAALSNSIQEQ